MLYYKFKFIGKMRKLRMVFAGVVKYDKQKITVIKESSDFPDSLVLNFTGHKSLFLKFENREF